MPDDNATPAPRTQVNVSPVVDGALGLTGWWKLAANLSAVGIISGSFLYLQHVMITWARQDRIEDRQLFRESIHSLNDEQNRHTGEIKGAMDATNGAVRDLTSEIRAWRGGVGKAPPPGGGP